MNKDASRKSGPDSGRRKFLLAAGTVPAVALASLAVTRPELPATLSVPSKAEPTKKGYHETEHIRKYYYTAGYF